jgi:hypothetical protein
MIVYIYINQDCTFKFNYNVYYTIKAAFTHYVKQIQGFDEVESSKFAINIQLL